VHLIATTADHGLHVDREQLERTGIEPGSHALVEIRHCTEEGSIAGERTFASGEEMPAPAERAPRTPSRSAALTALR
jgi:hypothetical protein